MVWCYYKQRWSFIGTMGARPPQSFYKTLSSTYVHKKIWIAQTVVCAPYIFAMHLYVFSFFFKIFKSIFATQNEGGHTSYTWHRWQASGNITIIQLTPFSVFCTNFTVLCSFIFLQFWEYRFGKKFNFYYIICCTFIYIKMSKRVS